MAVYSKKLNCLYFHIPKCAGQYIDICLNNEEDFVTYNFMVNSGINFYYDPNLGIRQEFYNNLSKFLIKEEEMSRCFEFTFVRNPYTRFISAFFYCKGNKFIDIEYFDSIDKCIANKDKLTSTSYFHIFKTQKRHIILSDSSEKKLDFIGRFENLKEDLTSLYKRLKLEEHFPKKRINENPINYGDYKQYYTQEILNFVNDHFREDFEEFDYPIIKDHKNL